MKIAVAFTACLILTACDQVPDLDTAAVEAIVADAQSVLVNAPIGSVERSLWPNSFAKLSPKSVRVTTEGLFIVTYSFFVEEAGIFVARDPSNFKGKPEGDPGFLQIGNGVFEFHVTG